MRGPGPGVLGRGRGGGAFPGRWWARHRGVWPGASDRGLRPGVGGVGVRLGCCVRLLRCGAGVDGPGALGDRFVVSGRRNCDVEFRVDGIRVGNRRFGVGDWFDEVRAVVCAVVCAVVLGGVSDGQVGHRFDNTDGMALGVVADRSERFNGGRWWCVGTTAVRERVVQVTIGAELGGQRCPPSAGDLWCRTIARTGGVGERLGGRCGCIDGERGPLRSHSGGFGCQRRPCPMAAARAGLGPDDGLRRRRQVRR